MNINVTGRSINYEIKGQGEPILLVHGWGGSIKSLESLAELLARKHKTIFLDLPGFGSSDLPDKDWGVEEYAKFIIDFIVKLKLKPVYYFGHSFGGALGIYLAVWYPNYIKKLIVAGASYKRSKPTASRLSRAFRWIPAPLKIIAYKILYPDSDISKVPILESNFRKIVTQDLSQIIGKVKAPTLILWGDLDNQTPLEDAKQLRNKIKKSKLRIYPDIGHNLPLKHPQLVAEEIDKFL